MGHTYNFISCGAIEQLQINDRTLNAFNISHAYKHALDYSHGQSLIPRQLGASAKKAKKPYGLSSPHRLGILATAASIRMVGAWPFSSAEDALLIPPV